MSGILKAFSKVSGKILDAAGLNFGKDLRDMNVSPYHLFELRKGYAKNEIYVSGYRWHGKKRTEVSFDMALEKNQNKAPEKTRQVCCQGQSRYKHIIKYDS